MAFPPLGILYVATAVGQLGLEVEVCDIAGGDDPLGRQPDFIGVSVLTAHIPYLRRLMPTLRGAYPGVPIILGGAHMHAVPKDAGRLGADAVCPGMGEGAMQLFIQGARGSIKPRYRPLPIPSRHLVDLRRYHYEINGKKATSMMTHRGCPYNCYYCSAHEKFLSMVALDRIDQEIQILQDLGYEGIQFYDDEINLRNERFNGLLRLLTKHDMTWRAFIRSNLFNASQAKRMKEAGCYEVCCGVESGSDEILKRVHKAATVRDATRAREIAKRHGLRFKAFMILGLPGETDWTFNLTKKWLLDNRPDEFDISLFTPYPGSVISKNPEKFGIVVEQDYWETPYFHKGTPGEYIVTARPRTLTAKELLDMREEMETEVRQQLGLRSLI